MGKVGCHTQYLKGSEGLFCALVGSIGLHDPLCLLNTFFAEMFEYCFVCVNNKTYINDRMVQSCQHIRS